MAKFKSPQELMAIRNPLARKGVEPVDIYAQPMQVEVEQSEATQEPISSSPKNEQTSPKKLIRQTAAPKKDSMARHYSTYLYPSQIKAIKLRAVEHDMDDYAIVQEALDEYFQKHPL
jgi:hypothetical protein